MGQEKQIREAIRTIAGTNQTSSLLFSAVVTKVDGDVCSVMHDSLEISGVKLRAIKNAEKSFLIVTPTKDSIVLVADLSNGHMRDLCVVQYSQIEKVELSFGEKQSILIEGQTDGVKFNGGENDGLVKVSSLLKKINALETDINDLKTIFGTWVTVSGDGGAALKTASSAWSSSSIVKTTKEDIENPKIKH